MELAPLFLKLVSEDLEGQLERFNVCLPGVDWGVSRCLQLEKNKKEEKKLA